MYSSQWQGTKMSLPVCFFINIPANQKLHEQQLQLMRIASPPIATNLETLHIYFLLELTWNRGTSFAALFAGCNIVLQHTLTSREMTGSGPFQLSSMNVRVRFKAGFGPKVKTLKSCALSSTHVSQHSPRHLLTVILAYLLFQGSQTNRHGKTELISWKQKCYSLQ